MNKYDFPQGALILLIFVMGICAGSYLGQKYTKIAMVNEYHLNHILIGDHWAFYSDGQTSMEEKDTKEFVEATGVNEDIIKNAVGVQ